MPDEAFAPERDPELGQDSDEWLVSQYVILAEAIQETKNRLAAIERELTIRMGEREATVMFVPGFDVAMKPKESTQYDASKVRASLGELLDPETLAKLIRPEEETITIKPERVDGNAARQVRKLGREYIDALDAATLPRPLVLTITPKEAI